MRLQAACGKFRSALALEAYGPGSDMLRTAGAAPHDGSAKTERDEHKADTEKLPVQPRISRTRSGPVAVKAPIGVACLAGAKIRWRPVQN
ncbi:hypothetical protein ACVWWD_004812 [Mesorhizobium sp. URHB0026]